MKEIVADWLPEKERVPQILYHTFEKMLDDNDYVGFIPEDSEDKYMIVSFGGSDAIAVKPGSWYTHKEQQKNQKGHYFIFDSANELLEWLQED